MIPSFEDLKKHNNYIFLVLVLILSNIQLYSTFNYLEANPPCCDSIAYFDISETYRSIFFEEHEYSKKRTYLFPLVIALIPRFARVDYYGFMLNYYIFTSIIFSFLVVIFYYYLKKKRPIFLYFLFLFFLTQSY